MSETMNEPAAGAGAGATAKGDAGMACAGSAAGGANGVPACANAGSAVADAAAARARTSRRRGGSRVIVTSGWGASAEQLQDVVVERQAHQPGEQGEPDVLARDHRPFAQRAAFGELDKVIQQVSPVDR